VTLTDAERRKQSAVFEAIALAQAYPDPASAVTITLPKITLAGSWAPLCCYGWSWNWAGDKADVILLSPVTVVGGTPNTASVTISLRLSRDPTIAALPEETVSQTETRRWVVTRDSSTMIHSSAPLPLNTGSMSVVPIRHLNSSGVYTYHGSGIYANQYLQNATYSAVPISGPLPLYCFYNNEGILEIFYPVPTGSEFGTMMVDHPSIYPHLTAPAGLTLAIGYPIAFYIPFGDCSSAIFRAHYQNTSGIFVYDRSVIVSTAGTVPVPDGSAIPSPQEYGALYNPYRTFQEPLGSAWAMAYMTTSAVEGSIVATNFTTNGYPTPTYNSWTSDDMWYDRFFIGFA